jgi:hypothetical protein
MDHSDQGPTKGQATLRRAEGEAGPRLLTASWQEQGPGVLSIHPDSPDYCTGSVVTLPAPDTWSSPSRRRAGRLRLAAPLGSGAAASAGGSGRWRAPA